MRLRSISLLSTVAVAALALSGCSSSGDDVDADATSAPTDLCAAGAPAGDAAEAVEVDGEVGEPSTAVFDAPIEIDELQAVQVSEGDGEQLETGDFVNYAMSAYDADTGEEIGVLGYEDGELLPSQISAEYLGNYIGCATVGSRFVIGFPATTATDGATQYAGQVYVFDVLGTTPTAAWGEEQDATSDLAEVELAEDGTPAITIADGAEAPETTELTVLKSGDGETVESGDAVMVQYTGVKLSDGSEFDSSWSAGTPASFTTTGVVTGFQKALEGQTVGSQVLAVIPPAEGYGVEGNEEHELYEETLVFVVDILAVQHAAAE